MMPGSEAAPSRGAASLLLSFAMACVALPQAGVADDRFDELLGRTGQRVASYLDDLSETNCTEHVLQEKLGASGKVVEKEESSFNYLIMLSDAGGELNLVESRLASEKGKKAKKPRRPLLVSNGFATLFLMFHPFYASGFQFSSAGDENVEGRTLSKVRFEHIPGTRSPAALAVRGREYPLDLAGTAWVDPQTGIITKISADLESGMEDVGLRRLRAEVRYQQVRFESSQQTSWLPTLATIEVESLHQHWRNTHRFTDYKRFSVGTKEKRARP